MPRAPVARLAWNSDTYAATSTRSQQGHDVDFVVDEELGGASDPDVFAAALRDDRFVITRDRGFGDACHYQPGHRAARGGVVRGARLPGSRRASSRIDRRVDDPIEAAAVLAYRVVPAQGFGDGNKRTALLLARWLLDRNGLDGSAVIRPDDQEFADLLVRAAAGADVEAEIKALFQSRG